jgi:pantoate--beta-alanine ligase
VQIINQLANLRTAITDLRTNQRRVALVPTMGALHEGHLQLVREAKVRADAVIVSIFVNPTQFGPNEDLAAYPRTLDADCAKLTPLGVDIVWAPDVAEMYPEGFATKVHVEGPSAGFCGGARPGHFDGVALVVTKLFNQTGADIACFGEKDYQQLAVIRQFVRDLDIDIEIVGVPTMRDPDGLAMSSRNAYLSAEQRQDAVALPNALKAAAKAISEGENVTAATKRATDAILAAGFSSIDYFALADAETLAPVTEPGDRPLRLLAAARIGKTRLIDNIAV